MTRSTLTPSHCIGTVVGMTVPAPTAPSPPLLAPPGLRGVVVAETALGDVLGEAGCYHYRGYPADELARRRSFADVSHLLLVGHLPDAAEAEAFSADLAGRSTLPPGLLGVLPQLARLGPDRASLARLRTALSLLGLEDGMPATYGAPPERVRTDALRVVAVVPTLQATLHRLRQRKAPVEPRGDLGAGAGWVWLLTGTEPPPEVAAAVETYLSCTIDHGFSASTFTARVVTSSGSDVVSAVVGALGTFAGPLHGGAPDRALDALDEIGTAKRAASWVRGKLASGERIMGFGHPVYRTTDPRATLLREVALGLGGPLVELAEQVETEVLAALAQAKPGRPLQTNVEYWAGVVMERCGIPREMFTPTFAVARVVGWAAHVVEQAAGSTIIRPSAAYVGPAAPRDIPVP